MGRQYNSEQSAKKLLINSTIFLKQPFHILTHPPQFIASPLIPPPIQAILHQLSLKHKLPHSHHSSSGALELRFIMHLLSLPL
ncbi:hypothetical protein EV2_032334 [Malus domestica]